MRLSKLSPKLKPYLIVTAAAGTVIMIFGIVMIAVTADVKWLYPFFLGLALLLLSTMIGSYLAAAGMTARMRKLVNTVMPPEFDGTGLPAVARLEDVRRTGLIVNEVNVQVELTLTVNPEHGEPYRATTQTLVPMWEMNTLTAGRTLAVRVDPGDPSRVTIDFDPPKEWLERVGRLKQSPVSADEIIATGSPATAQVVDIQLTGKTTGQVGGSPAHPERDDYPAVVLELLVQPPAGAGFTVKAFYSVPPGRLPHLTRGSLLPVRYVDHEGTPLVAVDWDAGHDPSSDGKPA